MKPEKQLYQWDVNQYLTELQPTAEFIDYPMGNEVIRLETDGTRCRIPDEVLQTYGGKTCYERYPDGTYRAYSFTVLYAPKPPDYVYTPEERTTFEALTARVDAAIEEIKRRADSGEFTPKKGVDYFTEAEKNELMESVSTGAIGEFRDVVDSATAEYNDNASEKLTTYDTNAEQHTTDYNRNAAEKLEAYNQNHTAKVAEYNANAETKTAEFDANAAALQTEVDRLRGECDQLAAENRKQENRISALMNLNKWQTYDILPEEGESASRTAPSGSKYVSVDKVGGKSIVWNQLNNPADNINVKKGAIQLNDDGSITISGTIQDAGKYNELQISQSLVFVKNQKYLVRTNKILSICVNGHDKSTTDALLYAGASDCTGFVALDVANGDEVNIEELVVQVYNLTQMFGSGNEPTIEQFKKLFVQKIYPYNSGEIISSTTANVELEGKNLWDDSDPAFTQVLLNAGFLYNSGVWHTNNVIYYSVNIGTIPPQSVLSYDILANAGSNPRIELFSGETRIISKKFESTGKWTHHNLNIPSGTVIDRISVNYESRGMCQIKNIQLERGTTETAYSPHTKQSISTGFPELKSAGTAHDEIDMDGGTIQRNVGTVDLGTLKWENNGTFPNRNVQFIARIPGRAWTENGLCDKFEKSDYNVLGTYALRTTGDQITFVAPEGTKTNALIESVSGATLYYELATPTTEPVTIPEALTEWLPVEPGGTVTFRNADESKQLPVPNAVSWVRKLDEVE